MEEKKTKSRKKVLIWVLILFFLPILILYILLLALPSILEMGLPAVLEQYGVANFAIGVEQLSWDDIEFKDVRAGTLKRPGIKIGRIKFLRSENKGQPNKIIISNAQIGFNELSGKFFIPGVTLPAKNPKLPSGEIRTNDFSVKITVCSG